ncbi:MAG: hypothetical protein QW046_01875 [Candidatus Micrarchaeaceae archaeon]
MNDEKIPSKEKFENLSEEEKQRLIKQYKRFLEPPFVEHLAPIEKLYIIGNLCALGDYVACENFITATNQLKKLAKEEDNSIAKELLIKLGLWEEETEEEKKE